MNIFRKRGAPYRLSPLTDREYVMAERLTTAITLADDILKDTVKWGVNDPDQCMAIATGLLALKWLIRNGRVSEFGKVRP